MEVQPEQDIKKKSFQSKDKEYIKSNNKQYYETNKQKRKEDDIKKSVTVICACGKRVKTLGLNSHTKTDYHKLYSVN